VTPLPRHALAAFAVAALLAGCRGGPGDGGSRQGVVLPTPVTPGVAIVDPGVDGTVHPRRVEFDPTDDGRLVVMERGGDLQVWRVGGAGGSRREVVIAASAIDARFTAGGRAIFVGETSGSVALWTAGGQLLWRRESAGEAVRAVAVRGNLLAGGTDRGDIHVWRHDGSLAHRRDQAHDGAIISLAFSASGGVLVSEGMDTLLRGWKVDGAEPSLAPLASYREASDRYRRMLPNLIRWDVQWGWDRSTAFAPDADVFAAATFGGGLQMWRTGGELVAERADAHDGHHLRAVAFSADGSRIASGGLDGTVRVWEVASLGKPPVVLRGHLRSVSSVAFDGAGRVASTSIDDTVRLWSATGEPIGLLPHHDPPKPPRGSMVPRGPLPPGDLPG